MKEGKCKVKSYCIFTYGRRGCTCHLNFEPNTRFNYKCSENIAMLERKNMTFSLTSHDFEYYFDVIE